MAGRPMLLTNPNSGMDSIIRQRGLNDGEAEVILIDLDRQHKMAADYYRQREACLAEIKNSKGSANTVNSGDQIGEFQRLIAERDFIYNQEQEYLSELTNMQGLYFKKKDMDGTGQQPPIDLLDKISNLIVDLKAKRNRIESQKFQYSSKFERKRNNLDQTLLNQSSVAGLSTSLFKVKGIGREMDELSKRMERVENLKVDSRQPDRLPKGHAGRRNRS